jgi:hypothetical protein
VAVNGEGFSHKLTKFGFLKSVVNSRSWVLDSAENRSTICS